MAAVKPMNIFYNEKEYVILDSFSEKMLAEKKSVIEFPGIGKGIPVDKYSKWEDNVDVISSGKYYYCQPTLCKEELRWTACIRIGTAHVRTLVFNNKVYLSSLDISGLVRQKIATIASINDHPIEQYKVNMYLSGEGTRVVSYESAKMLIDYFGCVDKSDADAWLRRIGFRRSKTQAYSRENRPVLEQYNILNPPRIPFKRSKLSGPFMTPKQFRANRIQPYITRHGTEESNGTEKQPNGAAHGSTNGATSAEKQALSRLMKPVAQPIIITEFDAPVQVLNPPSAPTPMFCHNVSFAETWFLRQIFYGDDNMDDDDDDIF